MGEKLSRRELAKRGLAGAAALALPSLAQPQDSRVEAVEKQLAKPLSPEARKLMEEALKGLQGASEARRKFKLPENSEPCTVYVPAEAKTRR